MDGKQMDLFSQKQPECLVIPFPCHLRHGKIRQAARSLSGAISEKQASSRVDRSVIALEENLRKVGISKDVIDREVRRFLIAVRYECDQIDSRWLPRLGKSKDQAR